MNNFFSGIFNTTSISISNFILCLVTSILIGLVLGLIYMYKNHYTKSFFITLLILPAIICVVIMMVNGNIGAGVAVAGAFSLVRFRSIPGNGKDISLIFFAMANGLLVGMGYLGFAVLFTIIVGIIVLVINSLNIKENHKNKVLRIVIPEDLNYYNVFDDIFKKYTSKCEMISSKTTNMGSMYKLTYDLILKSNESEKEFIDEIRCRNGNLEVSISNKEVINNEL